VLLVHAILRGNDAPALARAPTDLAPRTVDEAGLAAVVSAAPAGELTADDAVAHLDLLVALVHEVPVLPLVLGTGAPDDDAVRSDVLLPDGDRLRAQLDAVADLVEVRLDLAFDTEVAITAIARVDPEVHRLAERSRAPGAGMAEQMALGEAVAQRLAEDEEALMAEWTAELDGIAERSAVLSADEETRRLAFLVRRDRLTDADAAVARLRERVGDRAGLEYVGPLPVYRFLDDLDDLDAGPRPQPTSRWGW
jgi:hypothetical protein